MAISQVKPAQPAAPTDLKNIRINEEEGVFVAEIFGSDFTFSLGVNGYLLFMASTGDAAQFMKLIHSLLLVPGDFDSEEELAAASKAEGDRFGDLLAKQRDFGIERFFRLVNDVIEAAGNDHTAS